MTCSATAISLSLSSAVIGSSSGPGILKKESGRGPTRKISQLLFSGREEKGIHIKAPQILSFIKEAVVSNTYISVQVKNNVSSQLCIYIAEIKDQLPIKRIQDHNTYYITSYKSINVYSHQSQPSASALLSSAPHFYRSLLQLYFPYSFLFFASSMFPDIELQ